MPAVNFFNSSLFTQDLAAKSFAAAYVRKYPNGEATLFGLTALAREETAVQIEHGYFSKTMLFPSVVMGASALSTDTTLTVASTTNILPGMVLQVDTTKENIIVNTVASATSITVTRGVGTTAAQAIANSVNLWMIGNASEEGSTRPQSLYIAPARVINYTQIFRNSWSLSESARATDVIAGMDTTAEHKADAAAFHAADIEKMLFFGQKFQGTRNSQPFRCSGGLVEAVSQNAPSNITTLASTTNYTQLEAALDPVFNIRTDKASAPNRIAFVGGVARRVIHQICRLNSTYFVDSQKTEWGLQFDTIRIPRGEIQLVEHPLFNAFGQTSSLAKMAVVVDPATFNVAYLKGRKTTHKEWNTNGTPVDNGIDAVGGTLTTELTALIKVPEANAVVYNFTAGAAG
jgi:hypothetical protein